MPASRSFWIVTRRSHSDTVVLSFIAARSTAEVNPGGALKWMCSLYIVRCIVLILSAFLLCGGLIVGRLTLPSLPRHFGNTSIWLVFRYLARNRQFVLQVFDEAIHPLKFFRGALDRCRPRQFSPALVFFHPRPIVRLHGRAKLGRYFGQRRQKLAPSRNACSRIDYLRHDFRRILGQQRDDPGNVRLRIIGFLARPLTEQQRSRLR